MVPNEKIFHYLVFFKAAATDIRYSARRKFSRRLTEFPIISLAYYDKKCASWNICFVKGGRLSLLS